jgi:uncharacterized protein (DUF1501 family)
MTKMIETMPSAGRRALLRACCGHRAGRGAVCRAAPDFPRRRRRPGGQQDPVIFELSGGNDGLNTLVPYADDAYYRHRPGIGIRPAKLRRIDEHFGFNSGMAGFEQLFKDGRMAVVHGCGYAQPSFSHFTSMAYWHTGAPNSGEEYGWVGRLADAIDPKPTPNFLVNIDETRPWR